MGSKSKEKGKRGEREWVNTLKALGIPLAERTSYKQAEAGDKSPDVSHLLGVAEVKLRNRLTIGELYEALEQAENARSNESDPIRYVAARRDRSDWFVAMTPDQFRELYIAYLMNKVLGEFSVIHAARILLSLGEMLEGQNEVMRLTLSGYVFSKHFRIKAHGPYGDEKGCSIDIKWGGIYSSGYVLDCNEAKEELWKMYLEATEDESRRAGDVPGDVVF